MKNTLLISILSAFAFLANGQGAYFDPDPADVADPTVRLYVDISSTDCDCLELQDAAPVTNPLYIWTWLPNEARPDITVDGEILNVLNGEWGNSNENLRLSQDENNANLWYFDFAGASLADFYNVSPSTLYSDGISFLLKEKDGAPQDSPEQKSGDLTASITAMIDDFEIDFETILTGIDSPTEITNAGDERIFITERPGVVKVFYRDGTVEPGSFLDISGRVEDTGGEQGLLGLAFEPNFCESGRFYVNYTASPPELSGDTLVTRISRFSVDSENPSIADPNSEEVLIQFGQDFGNHNGGHIEFGSDGFLYIATGDGGSGGDPNNRAQDITSYLGKMLRIDVSPETGYEIPADNPYIFDDFGQDEIWSYGHRNPWKFAFDRDNGNMYIGDVGQNAFEEVNFEPADAEPGLNYGWRCYEGNSDYNLSGCEASDYVFPILDYPHSDGSFNHCSITGGRIYRGPSFEAFDGWYFYTDYCSGAYWAVTKNGEDFPIQEFGTIGQSFVSTFGEDVWGEIYFANGNGVHRLIDPNDVLLDPIEQSGDVLSYFSGGQSFEWFFEGESVGTDSELTATNVGVYTLVVTSENGCTIELEYEVTTLGLRGTSELEQLTIAPNPADYSVIVDLANFADKGNTLSMISADGRLVHSSIVQGDRHEIDISDLTSGVYVIVLANSDGQFIGQSKLIKR